MVQHVVANVVVIHGVLDGRLDESVPAAAIVAFALQPDPKTPVAQLMSSCCRMGPLTTNNGVAVCVVPCTPCKLTRSSHIACTPANTTGR